MLAFLPFITWSDPLAAFAFAFACAFTFAFAFAFASGHSEAPQCLYILFLFVVVVVVVVVASAYRVNGTIALLEGYGVMRRRKQTLTKGLGLTPEPVHYVGYYYKHRPLSDQSSHSCMCLKLKIHLSECVTYA